MSDLETSFPEYEVRATTRAEVLKEKKLYKQVPFILLCVLFIVSVAAGSIIINHLNKEIDIQSQELITQSNEITKFTNLQAELEGKINESSSKVDAVKQLSILSLIQHDMEGGIVTDDFVVDKVSIYPLDDVYSISIDLSTQPAMYASYKGKGAFTLTDREIRAKGTDITTKVKEYYVKNKTEKMPEWSKNKITLTIQNYEIGVFENGTLKLAGEK